MLEPKTPEYWLWQRQSNDVQSDVIISLKMFTDTKHVNKIFVYVYSAFHPNISF